MSIAGARRGDSVSLAVAGGRVLLDRSYTRHPGETLLTPEQARELALALQRLAATAEDQIAEAERIVKNGLSEWREDGH